jgi:ABC-type transport system involved in cytochrome bd biosynthesis fused ATPase/permease subunit
MFYKPILILIDEPTSSLDEVSEASITAMITELATFAITLVIAHRLKTVKDAVGLIDLSLLSSEQEIKVYTSQELEQRSEYYQCLCQGKVCLDS